MSISPLIWFVFIWAINSTAFFALAAAMSKHQKQIFGYELKHTQSKCLSYIGWSLLFASLALCTTQGHWSTHISFWVGTLTFSALFCGLCLSYYPQNTRKISLFTLIVANLCLVSALF